tara:strand:+ start:633 stop:986 length:354 start_codon:yes stop_codon:yes gene_type:complete
MNNYFNPFQEFEQEKEKEDKLKVIEENNTPIIEKKKNINRIVIENESYKTKPKNFGTNVATKYFNSSYNVNNSKPNIISLLKNNNLSDKNRYNLIKILYNEIKDEEYKKKISNFIHS